MWTFKRTVCLSSLLSSFLGCGSEGSTEPPPNGEETQVVLQSDRDNTLYEDSAGALSNGTGQFIFAGVTNQPRIRRATLRFDVSGSAIPAGATVDSAKLTLHMSRTVAGPATVTLHRLTGDWGEGGSDAPGAEGDGAPSEAGDATWIHNSFDTRPWSTNGGDFVSTASASTVVQSTGFYRWESNAVMVSDIRDWLDDPANNFGWIVIGDESMPLTTKRFDSREHVVIEQRPSLTVFFTRP